MSTRPKNITRITGDTLEHIIGAAVSEGDAGGASTGRIILYAIIPELTTTGTVTLRDAAATGGSNVIHVAAIGLTQAGKLFYAGAQFVNGLTVQLSVGTDAISVIWEAVP
jgi:hypothetical protein